MKNFSEKINSYRPIRERACSYANAHVSVFANFSKEYGRHDRLTDLLGYVILFARHYGQ